MDIAYWVGGSLMSSLWGLARTTLDVDLVALLNPGMYVRYARPSERVLCR